MFTQTDARRRLAGADFFPGAGAGDQILALRRRQRLERVEFHTLVQAGAGDGFEVFAEGGGAGEVLIDSLLRQAGSGAGVGGEADIAASA